jgi:hypothetical protein
MASMPSPTDLPPGFAPYWSGIDSTTPAGYMISTGLDSLGRLVTALLRGTDPATAVYLGHIQSVNHQHTVIGHGGAAIAWAPQSSEDAFSAIIRDYDH